MKGLYIFGGGDYAIKVLESLRRSAYNVSGFILPNNADHILNGIPCYDENSIMEMASPGNAFVAIGDATKRQKLMDKLRDKGWDLPYIVHSFSSISPSASIGNGVYIAAGVVIEANCSIGEGAIIDIGVFLDHGCVIPPFSHIRSKFAYTKNDLFA